MIKVQILVEAREFYLLQYVYTRSVAHSASYSIGTRVISQPYGNVGVKLNTHLHLVTMLTMSGAIPLLPCMPL
jgi:hypothetical protein